MSRSKPKTHKVITGKGRNNYFNLCGYGRIVKPKPGIEPPVSCKICLKKLDQIDKGAAEGACVVCQKVKRIDLHGFCRDCCTIGGPE